MPAIVSLIGKANSGKTTLLEKLIPELRRRGYRVGTIKHHVHAFDMDKPGKDTWRHKQAGARVVALSSPTGLGVIRDTQGDTAPGDLVGQYFQDVDLVITEGYKQADYPKIELHRLAAHALPLANRDQSWVAMVSDAPPSGLPQFAPDDLGGLATFLIARFIAPAPQGGAEALAPSPSRPPRPLPAATLAAGQDLILRHLPAPLAETVPLAAAARRIAAETIRARRPVPAFPQAARDGFAVGADPGAPGLPLPIVGEVAAGGVARPRLGPGQAIRIMTGGLLPRGCARVIPAELCQEVAAGVILPASLPGPRHIRAIGQEIKKGRRLVRGGEAVRPEQLAYLAATGETRLQLFAPPELAILATGSELLPLGQTPRPGQIIAGNGYLLAALAGEAGARSRILTPRPDCVESIVAALANYLSQEPPAPAPRRLIVTTGGMGGGKYDLLRESFHRLGGELHYDRLTIRPGGHTLFGSIAATPFFALPGPPGAVRLLFNELVRPALLHLQGRQDPLPPVWPATLTAAISNQGEGQALKGGILGRRGAQLTVRPCQRHEAADAIILIPAHRRLLPAGARVQIHPTCW